MGIIVWGRGRLLCEFGFFVLFFFLPDLGSILHPGCLSATVCKCLGASVVPLVIVIAAFTSLPALHA